MDGWHALPPALNPISAGPLADHNEYDTRCILSVYWLGARTDRSVHRWYQPRPMLSLGAAPALDGHIQVVPGSSVVPDRCTLRPGVKYPDPCGTVEPGRPPVFLLPRPAPR